MLKLEKTSNAAGLALRMRERERFFEPRVVKALAIALGLHIGGLTLFHAAPFDFSSSYLFPPIQVQMDSFGPGVSVSLSPLSEEELFLPPPIASIPTMEWIRFPMESSLSIALNMDIKAFDEIESRIWPKWPEPLQMAMAMQEPRIKMEISGDLARHPLISTEPAPQEMLPLAQVAAEEYVAYLVQLDPQTGELFWYERTASSVVSSVNLLTDKILLNLRFSSMEESSIIKGELHFRVAIPENNEVGNKIEMPHATEPEPGSI